MDICFQYRCAVAQQQCKDTLLLAKCNCPLLSAAVQNRLTAGLCHCKYTYGYLLSDRCAVAQQQCKATLLLAKCNCPLLSAAVQNRLTAGLCHCKYTYGYLLSIQVCSAPNSARTRCSGDLLLVQVCSDPTAVQCHCFWQSAIAPCSVLLCKTAADSKLLCKTGNCKYTYGYLLFNTGVQWPNSSARHTAFGKVQLPPAQCCCAKQADSRLVPLQIHLWIFAFSAIAPCRCAVAQQQCKATVAQQQCCFWQSAMLSKTG